MFRTRVAVLLGIVLVGILTISANSALGGCHGGCFSPTGGSPHPCSGSVERSAVSPMDVATTGSDPSTNLEFYSISVGNDPLDFSRIYAGEVTVFYVTSGTITFNIASNVADGTIRVVNQATTPSPVADGPVEIDTGGALFVDAQEQSIDVSYEKTGTAEATLLIASAMPCVPASVSPLIPTEPAAPVPSEATDET